MNLCTCGMASLQTGDGCGFWLSSTESDQGTVPEFCHHNVDSRVAKPEELGDAPPRLVLLGPAESTASEPLDFGSLVFTGIVLLLGAFTIVASLLQY